jgi:hypothetical protein
LVSAEIRGARVDWMVANSVAASVMRAESACSVVSANSDWLRMVSACVRALQLGELGIVPPAVREPAGGTAQRHRQQQAQAGGQRAVLDRDHGNPFKHSSRSAWRRRVRPRTSLPPTLFHSSSALHAPTMSPAFVRRAMLELQKPLTPML